MARILEGLFDKEGPSKKDIKSIIKRNRKEKAICYVLITCSEPNENGSMEVEMKYEGERWLASYLVKSAQGSLEGEEDERL